MVKVISSSEKEKKPSMRKIRVTKEMIDAVAEASKIKNNRFHVLRTQGEWVVRKNGAKRALRIFDTSEQALTFAEEKQKSEPNMYIVVHDAQGKIVKMIK